MARSRTGHTPPLTCPQPPSDTTCQGNATGFEPVTFFGQYEGTAVTVDGMSSETNRARTVRNQTAPGVDEPSVGDEQALRARPGTAVCMWPTCARPVEYQAGGRRQQFCQDSHRLAYRRERIRLIAELAAATHAHETATTRRSRSAASHDVGVCQWQLVRFPAL